jgi:hypothetical protein
MSVLSIRIDDTKRKALKVISLLKVKLWVGLFQN